jgi:hypothetical protein
VDTSSISSPGAEADQTRALPVMNSDTLRSVTVPQEPAGRLKGISCIHHWLVGPPTYSHNGLVEETEWDCIRCGEHRLNVLLCPFNEVQDEWVQELS